MTTPRTRLTALAGAALVTVIAAGCTPSAADPGPAATNVKPPTSTTSSTSKPPSATSSATSSTSTPAPTSLTPSEQAEARAYADAEQTYRAWVKNYGVAAAAGFDAKKLDSRLATPALIDVLTKQFKTFHTQGGTGKYTQDIRWMKPDRYRKGETVTFQLCAVTDLRFLQDGKDVTITPAGAPSPVETEPQLRYVSVETIDSGKSWRSSTILYSSDDKKSSC